MNRPALFLHFLFFSITICFLSCSESTLYYQGHHVSAFDYKTHPQPTNEKIVSITPAKIREIIDNEHQKITWLLLLNFPCMNSISAEVELYRKHSQHVQLFIISTRYQIGDMKRLEQENGYPVYFISVSTDRAHTNRKRFVMNVFGKDVSKEAKFATNIFVYRKEIVHTCYSGELKETTLQSLIPK
jgi:hypothetical protein